MLQWGQKYPQHLNIYYKGPFQHQNPKLMIFKSILSIISLVWVDCIFLQKPIVFVTINISLCFLTLNAWLWEGWHDRRMTAQALNYLVIDQRSLWWIVWIDLFSFDSSSSQYETLIWTKKIERRMELVSSFLHYFFWNLYKWWD